MIYTRTRNRSSSTCYHGAKLNLVQGIRIPVYWQGSSGPVDFLFGPVKMVRADHFYLGELTRPWEF